MPCGFIGAHVDGKGRLIVPVAVMQTMSMHRDWSLSLAPDGNSFQLKSAGENAHRVEIDENRRLQLPTELSADFKGQEVRLLWREDHLIVMTLADYEKRIERIKTLK